MSLREQLEASVRLTKPCSGCPYWRRWGKFYGRGYGDRTMICTSLYVPDPLKPQAAMVNPLFGRTTHIECCTHWLGR